MTTLALPKAVDDFVAATNSHDTGALLAVFAPDAVVIDDGAAYSTPEEVRSWLVVHQIEPRIVITATSFDAGTLVASVDGDFAGGPLRFAFTFATRGDSVVRLTIEPA